MRIDKHITKLNLLRVSILHYASKCWLLFILSIFTTLPTLSQHDKICIGTKSVYAADGLPGSTFDYSLDQYNAGTIIQTHRDTIIVEWSDAKGFFRLGVRETSQQGCEGNWAFLDVEIVGEFAQFSQPFYTICGERGAIVDFNKSDFQHFYWADNSISQDGYITKPGIYELITIDHNNCQLSSFVEVFEAQNVKISLEEDKSVCSPEFILYAFDTQDNPDETIYTWSTGERGEFITQIRIENHDIYNEYIYWVRAEFEGCMASDTITIFACGDIPDPWEGKIPNTFTPNDDGDNDVWNIFLLKEYPESIVEVFDRWGRKVFASEKGYPTPWDGRDTTGRVLPMEAYFYMIHLNDGVNKKPIMGTITIIR